MKNMMNEQKEAVDSGYWTLYRYDPRRVEKGANPFQLDSQKIKYDLMQYLGGQNRFEQLRRADTKTAEKLHQGLRHDLHSRHDKFVKLAMDEYEMLEHLKKQLGEEVTSKSVMVLYGSETGTAAGLAQVRMLLFRLSLFICFDCALLKVDEVIIVKFTQFIV